MTALDGYGDKIPLDKIIAVRMNRFINDYCPNCELQIGFYWLERSKPWCKRCSMYYTKSGPHVINNICTEEQYNKILRGG